MSTVVAFDIREMGEVDLARFADAVPAERRERAARFRFADDRKRCLAAGVVLHYAVIRHTGGTPRAVEVTTNEFGKPTLSQPAGVHVNVSHSGDWVVCVTSATEIGIDIERTDEASVGLAHRFAPDEYSYVQAAPPHERPRRFARIWTLKESYLKYLGRGLGVPMDSFSVATEDRHPRILRGTLDPRPFLKQVAHGDDYYIAECSADDSPITVEQATKHQLLAVC